MKKLLKQLLSLVSSNWQLCVILLLAAGLRLYQLGTTPPGFTWDEAAIGYNGYAIVHTRRDEWLQRLPVSFRSFGDYKAPLAIYINGVFTFIFGLNRFAVRLPFALSGIAGVGAMFFLTKKLYSYLKLEKKSNQLQLSAYDCALLAALGLAISPWHLHFTRAGFESGLALTFVLWGGYFFLSFLQTKHSKNQTASQINKQGAKNTNRLFPPNFFLKQIRLLVALTFLIAAMYSYHSAKVFVPLLLLIAAVINFKFFWQNKVITAFAAGYSLLLLRPMILDSLFGSGLKRAGTLVFALNYAWPTTVWLITKHLFFHLSPQFLLLGQVSTLRHGTGRIGVLLPMVYLLVLIGLAVSIKQLFAKKNDYWRLAAVAVGWIVIGLLPAALGKLTPQANRALLALPGFIWLSVLGLYYCCNLLKAKFDNLSTAAFLKIWLLLLAVNLSFYLYYYYQRFAPKSTADFMDGYLEAFEYVKGYRHGTEDKPNKSKIIFTSDYGQPYIYALFVHQINPIWYQGGSLNTYQFTNNINQSDLEKDNVVIVASKDDDIPLEKADKVIYGRDGSVRFKIYVR